MHCFGLPDRGEFNFCEEWLFYSVCGERGSAHNAATTDFKESVHRRGAIWLADLSVGEELKIPLYSVQSGGAYTLTIKVVGKTTVSVAAGEFEVYELHVSGAQANVTILARKEAPHYLIKQELTRTG